MSRKKKTEKQKVTEIAKPATEKSSTEADPIVIKIDKGSHLTVTHYSNGKTDLVWDFEALNKDIQTALSEYKDSIKTKTPELSPKEKPASKAKNKQKKKNEA